MTKLTLTINKVFKTHSSLYNVNLPPIAANKPTAFALCTFHLCSSNFSAIRSMSSRCRSRISIRTRINRCKETFNSSKLSSKSSTNCLLSSLLYYNAHKKERKINVNQSHQALLSRLWCKKHKR